MSYYEHIFLLRADITAQQAEKITKEFSQIVADNGGKVVTEENWGLKTLAYIIKKNRKAYYTLFNLDTPPAAVQELERQERLHEDVLRYMTVRVDELQEGPSVQMKARTSRDEREGSRR